VGSASAATFTVTNNGDAGVAGDLRFAINAANAAGPGSHTINFTTTGTIALTAPLPILGVSGNQNITIAGPGSNLLTVSGNNTTRVFFADQGNISISGLSILAGNATGGRGGDSQSGGGAGGGGGMGAGGGLYINNTANVRLIGVNFANNRAIGGTGGTSTGSPIPVAFTGNYTAGGGGGGLGGAGGLGTANGGILLGAVVGAGGGGGLYGSGGNNTSLAGGGGGGQATNGADDGMGGGGGGGSITSPGTNGLPPNGGAPSGGSSGSPGMPGGFGGGGGGGDGADPGGNGGTHGGGGGAGQGAGGHGGDHGGGGGGAQQTAGIASPGGNGGYGGGGGGGAFGFTSGTGGFGAGNAGTSNTNGGNGGDGGSGFGGAVFVRQGGTLVVVDGNLPAGNVVAVGSGGTGGLLPGSAGIAATGRAFYLDNVNLTFVTTGANVSVVGDDIAGFGALLKAGTGTLSLTGSSDYTGPTTVAAGTLNVNGSITSSVLVNNGATLSGIGRVGPTVMNGTISPGNSIGTLSINGNYVQNPGSTYVVEINTARQSDRIQVTGQATINGGTVQVIAQPGNYAPGIRYLILNANNGRAGAYNNLTLFGLNRSAVLLYQGNNIFLVTALTRPELIASAQTFNQNSVLNVLLAPNLPPGVQTILDNVSINTIEGASLALDELSGAIHGSLLSYSRFNSVMTGQLLNDQLQGTLERPDDCGDSTNADRLLPCGWNAWLRMRGSSGGASNSDGNSGLDATAVGGLFGLDRWLSKTTRVGIYGGYNHSRVQTQGLNEDASVNMYDIGINASQTNGPWYLLGNAGYGMNEYTVKRTLNFGALFQQADSNYHGNLFNMGLEGGRILRYGDLAILPHLGLQFINYQNNDFIESGGGPAGLIGTSLDGRSMFGSFGSRLSYDLIHGPLAMEWRLQGRLLHDFMGDDRSGNMQFVSGGNQFMIQGAQTGQTMFYGGIGTTINYQDRARFFLDYTVLTSTRFTNHMGTGGVEVRY